MLLKAITQICAESGQPYMPGDIFAIRSEKEGERLIRLGAAIPAKKHISIEMAVSDKDDGRNNED